MSSHIGYEFSTSQSNNIVQASDHTKLYEFKAWQQNDILEGEELPSYNAFCIKLRIRDVIRTYFQWQDGTRYALDRESPTIEKTLWIPDFTSMSYHAARYIGHVLPCPRIPDNVRTQVAYDISSFAQSMTTFTFNSVNTIRPFVLDVAIVDVDFNGEHEATITWATSELIEVQEFKPVPATKSSIEALERTGFHGSSSTQQCVICLEKLLVGSEVITMPCTHVYHENCIIRWLETNHLCPLCRFPMPH